MRAHACDVWRRGRGVVCLLHLLVLASCDDAVLKGPSGAIGDGFGQREAGPDAALDLPVDQGSAMDSGKGDAAVSDSAPPVPDSAPPVTDSAPPIADSGQPIADSAQPSADSAQPIADSGQPIADSAQPIADSGQPTADSGPPSPCAPKCCTAPLPPEAQLADTTNPKTVVGTGTAASCTHAALAAAVAKGGVITFNCGGAPATIAVTATLELATDRDTVIDGGHSVTLDGLGKVRILRWNSPGWMTNTHSLTLQRLSLVNGKASGNEVIPTCPAPCSQGFNDGEGGALYMRDGALRVIDATFTNNQAALLGPDTGGGAIYVFGGQPAHIVGSTFIGNKASNAGAVGALFAELNIFNCRFQGNKAVGQGANNNDPSQCSCINNGQNQVGSGGNGGAIYSDGVGLDVSICGTTITSNTANEFGAAVFFTSNDPSKKGTLGIRDSTLSNNQGNGVWEAAPGISTNADFPAPINSVIQP